MNLPPQPERIVTPSTRGYKHHPIVSVSLDYGTVLEEDGTLFEGDPFAYLYSHPSAIVATHNPARLLKHVEDSLLTPAQRERFRFKVGPRERVNVRLDGTPVSRQVDTLVHAFGWLQPGSKKSYERQFYPICPIILVGATARDLYRHGSDLESLLDFGLRVRDFAQRNDIPLKPTSGGFANRLLRDKRFYPEARRKVPKGTNATARDTLPGNYYRRSIADKERYNVHLVDQENSHHYVAQRIAFPNANSLFVRGHFHRRNGEWLHRHHPAFDHILSYHGLLFANVSVPLPNGKDDFRPPYLEGKAGFRHAFVYTNELDLLKECGAHIDSIIAAWVSPELDSGLNAYAEWATREIVNHPTDKPWLKPVLHSTYGVLAARPRKLEIGFRPRGDTSGNGERKHYPTYGGWLDVMAHTTKREREALTTNVIHRGMIEAETRKLSIQLARQLRDAGCDVLGIYSDCVIVNANCQLPLLPPPWRVKETLTNFQWLNSTSYVSDQEHRLPGIPRDDRERISRRMSFRATLAQRSRRRSQATA